MFAAMDELRCWRCKASTICCYAMLIWRLDRRLKHRRAKARQVGPGLPHSQQSFHSRYFDDAPQGAGRGGAATLSMSGKLRSSGDGRSTGFWDTLEARLPMACAPGTVMVDKQGPQTRSQDKARFAQGGKCQAATHRWKLPQVGALTSS